MIPSIPVKGAVEKSAASTRRRVSLIRHLHFRRDETGTQYACRGAAENVRRHCSDWFRSSSFCMARASIVMVACMRSYSSSLARFWLAAFLRRNFLHFDCDATPSLLQPICFWLYISSRPRRLHCEDRAYVSLFEQNRVGLSIWPTPLLFALQLRRARNNIRDELRLALSFFRGDSLLHCDCGACATLLDLLLSFHLLCAATARIASVARVRANLIGVAVSFIFFSCWRLYCDCRAASTVFESTRSLISFVFRVV